MLALPSGGTCLFSVAPHSPCLLSLAWCSFFFLLRILLALRGAIRFRHRAWRTSATKR